MSLRLRLALALVGLAAVGLLVADVATFTSLRAFLVRRVDQQLESACGPVALQLHVTQAGDQAPPVDTSVQLPPGTYGELRDADGASVLSIVFDYGQSGAARPVLPAQLPGSGRAGADPYIFSAGAVADSPVRFRVLAQSLGSDGTLIVAVPLTDVSQTLRRLLFIAAIVSLSVLIGLAAAAWLIVRRGLRPLEHMGEVAGAIAAGDLSQRVAEADGRSEVGRLGLALNAMLTQIEQAFAERRASEERLRRFLADASHELRTPLTSIRGYAELFKRGASSRPEDLGTSMRRIEEEAARMGVLVDDLLLLARLGEKRPLERRPVDLRQVAADAVGDAQTVGADREITLVCDDDAEVATPDQCSGFVVTGDEARLRQVAANLMSNALTHTPSGTPVEVRLRAQGEQVFLEVTDHGPGLAAGHVAEIFEPFFRLDPGRGRDTGGEGLGLAIVAAIVHAHGGEVAVSSESGAGATFTVTLPR